MATEISKQNLIDALLREQARTSLLTDGLCSTWYEILMRELRLGMLDFHDDRRKSTDLFIFVATNESRKATRIGGCPYRSKDMPWPVDGEGTPYKFLAQLYFGDSTDLIPRKLPGEVLLIFSKSIECFSGDTYCEWISEELPEANLVVEPELTFYHVPLTGLRYRTFDYSTTVMEQFNFQDYVVAVDLSANGTKIGGYPNTIDWDRSHPNYHFLAQLGPVNFTLSTNLSDRILQDAPQLANFYPENDRYTQEYEDDFFEIGDRGGLHIYISKHSNDTVAR